MVVCQRVGDPSGAAQWARAMRAGARRVGNHLSLGTSWPLTRVVRLNMGHFLLVDWILSFWRDSSAECCLVSPLSKVSSREAGEARRLELGWQFLPDGRCVVA